MNNKMTVLFSRYIDGEKRQYIVSGRIAQTLVHLVQAGPSGITPLEMSNTWAIRLGAYVFTLRHDYNVDIQTVMEPHDGGNHARYVLLTPVEINEAYPTPV